ncbi:MAG: fibronectin type III domain-containing protein, partial [Sphingobacteriales bacterium]
MKKIYFLMLMLLALHTTRAQNTCATAVPIAAIPFSSGPLTTCGTGNDYAAGSYFNTSYGAGEDFVFSIDITTAPVTYKMALGGAATWKIASVHNACPPTTGNSIGGVTTSSGATGEAQVTFAANGTYYIIVDTWPTPTCGEFTLSLSIPPPPPANDNAGGAIGLTVNTDYNCGTTYYVRAYTTAASSTQTAFNICVGTPPPPPANDEATGAVLLTVNTDYACGVTTAGTTISSTQSAEAAPTCSATGINDDVWFRFVATAAAHRISFSGVTTGTMVAALYSGTPGSLAFITGACASTTLNATGLNVGDTYYVRAYTSVATATTQTNFNICVGTPPPPPANDNSSGAIALPVNADFSCTTTTPGTTVSATASPEAAPTCSATGIDDDVWFSFVATSASHRVSFSGVSTGTMVAAIYTGTPGSLTFLTGACASTTLNASGLTIGDTYYVRAYTTATTSATQANFTICVGTPLPPPVNDVCSGAITIPVGATCSYQTFTTAGATDNDETGDCTLGTEAAVWFKFVATQTYATITVDGAVGFDAVVGVLSACGSTTVPTGGACVDATADGGIETRILSGLTVGETYYIQVYDYQADVLTTSAFDICVVSEPCGVPTGVSAGAVTSTGASITWPGTGTYILEYGLTGFTPGTGATAGAGGTIISPANSVQAITGLTSSTTYQVYVRQDCTSTGGGYSANSTVVSFTTLCDATNVPYVQNFNGITPPAIPACMSIENVAADTRTWRTITGLTSFPEITSNVIGYQYNTDGITPANDWLYTQGINLSTGTSYTVSFR